MEHIVLDSEDTLSKAMSDIMQTKKAVVVTKNGEYFGMIDSGNLRNLSDDPSVMKAGTAAVSAPALTSETTLIDTCRLFFSSRLKALPVLQKKKIISVISVSDLLGRLRNERLLNDHFVSDVMSKPGVRIEEDGTIAQAQSMMRKNHVRRLIVTKGGSLAGILSTYDMAEALLAPRQKAPILTKEVGSKEIQIRSMMQSEVATIGPDDSLSVAADKMINKGVASLVVVEGNVPVGIVTAHDILETVFAKDEPNVLISGLHGEHRSLYPDVVELASKEIGKIERSVEIQYLSLHFKFHNKLCTVKARLIMKGVVNASASDYVAMDAVKAVLEELHTMVREHKPNKMHGR